MKIGEIRTLAGPNIYSYRPVLLMTLDLEDLAGKESREWADFNERLLKLLPGLAEHHCSLGRAGGFIERLHEGTYFGHIVEHVALELTELAGVAVAHGKTRYTGEGDWYWVAIEYRAEQGTKYLLRVAVELVESLVGGEEFSLNERLEEARRIMARTELGPSARAIVDEAARRRIPWRRIGDESLILLGYGRHRRFIQAAMTDRTSAIGVDIASDKELTKRLLCEAGISVPDGKLVQSEAEAVTALAEIGVPAVVKPQNACQGKGVALNLNTPAQVAHAFRRASQYSPKVIVERQFMGRDYRVLVIDGQVVAASERIPARVEGDGDRTIRELIEMTNRDPRRGQDHETSLTRIEIDQPLIEYLDRAGLTLDSVPERGRSVQLRDCANLSTGGTARDVTESAHPEVVAMCERAARLIGLDICGIDLILSDIAAPLEPDTGIIEINAAPGLRMHVSPSEGQDRQVGQAIVDTLYPDGSTGRIPIISVTGTNGKTTITRMIGHLLSESGLTVGMTTTDGILIGGREVVKGDTTGPRSAQTVLADPAVEVAVLETARGGIVRGGLGYDWSDISIISNVRLDHFGQDGIKSLDDLLFIKSLVAERVREGGTLILNADDERLAQLMDDSRVKLLKKKVVYFSLHPPHVLIRRHRDAGGTAYLYQDGWIVEAADGSETKLVEAVGIPVTLNGAASFQLANLLAAVAAARAMGLSGEQIAASLKSFRADLHNAGRAGLYRVPVRNAAGGPSRESNGYVLVDYGHNPDAFSTISQLAAAGEWSRITGIVGVPGDRDDSVIVSAGAVAAQGFQRIIIREDHDLRGRRSGEVAEMLRRAILNEAPDRECRVILDEIAALRTALRELGPDEILVIFYEKLDPVLSLLREFGAEPVQTVPQLPVTENEAMKGSGVRRITARRRVARG